MKRKNQDIVSKRIDAIKQKFEIIAKKKKLKAKDFSLPELISRATQFDLEMLLKKYSYNFAQIYLDLFKQFLVSKSSTISRDELKDTEEYCQKIIETKHNQEQEMRHEAMKLALFIQEMKIPISNQNLFITKVKNSVFECSNGVTYFYDSKEKTRDIYLPKNTSHFTFTKNKWKLEDDIIVITFPFQLQSIFEHILNHVNQNLCCIVIQYIGLLLHPCGIPNLHRRDMKDKPKKYPYQGYLQQKTMHDQIVQKINLILQ